LDETKKIEGESMTPEERLEKLREVLQDALIVDAPLEIAKAIEDFVFACIDVAERNKP
jgi:hypothetical protein